jgi:hypothetical protein
MGSNGKGWWRFTLGKRVDDAALLKITSKLFFLGGLINQENKMNPMQNARSNDCPGSASWSTHLHDRSSCSIAISVNVFFCVFIFFFNFFFLAHSFEFVIERREGGGEARTA